MAMKSRMHPPDGQVAQAVGAEPRQGGSPEGLSGMRFPARWARRQRDAPELAWMSFSGRWPRALTLSGDQPVHQEPEP